MGGNSTPSDSNLGSTGGLASDSGPQDGFCPCKSSTALSDAHAALGLSFTTSCWDLSFTSHQKAEAGVYLDFLGKQLWSAGGAHTHSVAHTDSDSFRAAAQTWAERTWHRNLMQVTKEAHFLLSISLSWNHSITGSLNSLGWKEC